MIFIRWCKGSLKQDKHGAKISIRALYIRTNPRMNLSNLFDKAKNSKRHRWLLTYSLNRFVPFNQAHRFKVEALGDTFLRIKVPYRKSNLNHLKGIHACAQATAAEISSGLLLIARLDPKRYRLILQKLDLEYHYQAKNSVTARFEADDDWLQDRIFEPLEQSDRVYVDCPIDLYDEEENLVASAIARWQIKDWQAVRTKV